MQAPDDYHAPINGSSTLCTFSNSFSPWSEVKKDFYSRVRNYLYIVICLYCHLLIEIVILMERSD
jgi:hypothetical protein